MAKLIASSYHIIRKWQSAEKRRRKYGAANHENDENRKAAVSNEMKVIINNKEKSINQWRKEIMRNGAAAKAAGIEENIMPKEESCRKKASILCSRRMAAAKTASAKGGNAKCGSGEISPGGSES